jgi:hypothetical protein
MAQVLSRIRPSTRTMIQNLYKELGIFAAALMQPPEPAADV